MFNSWTCVAVVRGPGIIPEEVRHTLNVVACKLSLDSLDATRFNEQGCEGYIETAWNTCGIGSRYGILFRSEVDCEDGTYQVNFLLSLDDLKEGRKFLERLENGNRVGGPITDPEIIPNELRDFSPLRSNRSLQ